MVKAKLIKTTKKNGIVTIANKTPNIKDRVFHDMTIFPSNNMVEFNTGMGNNSLYFWIDSEDMRITWFENGRHNARDMPISEFIALMKTIKE